MDTLVLIPARKGSRGIKNKNKTLIFKKRLIEFTFEALINSKLNAEVCLSTDDIEIIKIGKKYNINAPFVRPQRISKDKTSINEVIFHALGWYKKNKNFIPENILILQPTSPGRDKIDIKSSFEIFKRSKNNSLVSVTTPKNHPCEILIKKKDKYKFVINCEKNLQRQEYPKTFYIDGSIYIFKTKYFLKKNRIFDENSLIYISKSKNNIDIDTKEDLEFFKFLISRNEK